MLSTASSPVLPDGRLIDVRQVRGRRQSPLFPPSTPPLSPALERRRVPRSMQRRRRRRRRLAAEGRRRRFKGGPRRRLGGGGGLLADAVGDAEQTQLVLGQRDVAQIRSCTTNGVQITRDQFFTRTLHYSQPNLNGNEDSYSLNHTYDRFLATSHHYRDKNRKKN